MNTMYYNDYVTNLDYFDMNMRPKEVRTVRSVEAKETGFPGRTYRFFAGPVIHPFGFGLSYTTFAHAAEIGQIRNHRLRSALAIDVYVKVTNTGSRQGDESVLLFVKSPLVGVCGWGEG